jgi:hypothetical protein
MTPIGVLLAVLSVWGARLGAFGLLLPRFVCRATACTPRLRLSLARIGSVTRLAATILSCSSRAELSVDAAALPAGAAFELVNVCACCSTAVM